MFAAYRLQTTHLPAESSAARGRQCTESVVQPSEGHSCSCCCWSYIQKVEIEYWLLFPVNSAIAPFSIPAHLSTNQQCRYLHNLHPEALSQDREECTEIKKQTRRPLCPFKGIEHRPFVWSYLFSECITTVRASSLPAESQTGSLSSFIPFVNNSVYYFYGWWWRAHRDQLLAQMDEFNPVNQDLSLAPDRCFQMVLKIILLQFWPPYAGFHLNLGSILNPFTGF